MQYVRLGNSGLKVSRLCLGCMTYGSSGWRPWILGEKKARPFIERALEAGINFFDTADFYSLGASEKVVGKALGDMARREDVVIATKVHMPMGDGPNARGLSRKHILEGIDASLKRLGTDYVDLYQIHRLDHDTPMEEILDALNDVVRAGKALYLGASSMWAWQFMKALGIQEREGFARFMSMQNHYNLLYREEEREMLPLCGSEGIGVMPWSPLARGLLSRPDPQKETVRKGSDLYVNDLYGEPFEAEIRERVRAVANELGRAPAQVALAWLLSRPAVTAPIVGASKRKHLEDAIGALDLTLDMEQIALLEEPYRPRRVAGHE
jgi:aryl-alcohol dehydrogenase-like predicted oxidoreductase